MQEHEALIVAKYIQAAWGKEFTDEQLDVWTDALAPIPYEVANQVAQRLVRTNKWAPSIAEFLAAVWEFVDPLPTAEQAYAEARNAARTFSPYSGGVRHEWSHPLIEQAAKVVGIETMAYSEEPTVVAAQFRRVYENLRERAQIRRQQETLRLPTGAAPALTEGTNHA